MNTLKCPKLHVIACDLDDSLVAGRSRTEQQRRASDEALRQIGALVTNLRVQTNNSVFFGSATGRSFDSIGRLAGERPVFSGIFQMMDFHIASVGTAIYTRTASGFIRAGNWPDDRTWNRNNIMELFSGVSDLQLQESAGQDTHKLSYTTKSLLSNPGHAANLQSLLNTADLRADVIVSGHDQWRFVDVLPAGANKGSALLQIPRILQDTYLQPGDGGMPADSEICFVAGGDSMNDQALLAAADVAIIPANVQPDLREWVNAQASDTFYISDEQFATGILQGLEQHFYGSSKR